MKFLIVDDSIVMRRIVKKLLRKAGYGDDAHEVLEAKSGPEGIDLLLRHEPDIVITDFDMPEMTGIEMIKALREKNIDFAFGLATAHCSAEVLMEGHRYPAAVNIGIAPTIRHDDVTIEAHILDFSEDVLGREIEVVFHRRIRSEKKFPNREALSAQIASDVGAVREYFES